MSTISAGTTSTTTLIASGDTTGSLVFKTNDTGSGGTTAMTIDTSQNVGIGTTSPADILHLSKAGDLYLRVANTSTGINAYLGQDSNGTYIGNTGASVVRFIQGSSERMRIDSSGRWLVGTTAYSVSSSQSGEVASTGVVGFVMKNTTAGNYALSVLNEGTSGTRNLVRFYEGAAGGTARGSITTDGSTVSYNTTSDYRLKENIEPMTGALETVAQLKPCTYTWKDGGFSGQGFIAHELQEVVPDCVTGEKDAVDADGNPQYQGIDTSFLVATLTAAIQELKAELDATKAEVAALKEKI